MRHVMIDLETLGTGPYAVILSVGAREFDPVNMNIGRGYYQNVDRDSQGRRSVSQKTVDWWEKQSQEAKDALKKDTLPLDRVLSDFRKWLPKEPIVWGNGATFDITILGTAYGLNKTPWKFRDVRDMRTIKALKLIDDDSVTFKGTLHNALDDATWQAEYVCRALNKYLKMRRN